MKNVDAYGVGERVAAGMALLDEKFSGWASYIQVDCLDIGVERMCACAHLYGSYAVGRDILGIEDNLAAQQFGFWAHTQADYDALTDEWRVRVAERQAVTAAA